ncbi:sugar phosphate isomerase/epimerase family protein [Halostagnicola kamekurae]|uniref:Inosose dehydratase n=1 Tax=Halostagnicola kamekurae TaxID=619731 RepID=A0A1I6UJ36_9EURY|nr:sugar phosphate isomerase/epimerase [Halostagnicola kamekurae]SFT01475.1 inosose dehydratase [Halostagnicola kamekurae]
MGVGYTTIMYDPAEVLSEGLGDFAACRYDGVEIGLGKVEYMGVDSLQSSLEEYGLDIYCVMAGWLNNEEDVEAAVDGAAIAAELDARFLGILPPPRGQETNETFDDWLDRICTAAADAGVTPVLHHHGASHVESPDEIAHWLERAPDNLELLYDTAHYQPYGDVIDGISRFADDIAYVHLKDIDPTVDFQDHVDTLSAGNVQYDSLFVFLTSFVDLGAGVIDFEAVDAALEQIGYDGQITIEIENERNDRLVHAKRNIDHWNDATGA